MKPVRKVPRFGIDLQALDEDGKPVVVPGQQLHMPAIAKAMEKAWGLDKQDQSK